MGSDWLFALIPLALGTIFFTIGAHGIRRARALRRTGAKAQGQIVRHDTSSGDRQTLYHPVAAWMTPDGHWWEHSATMGRSFIGRFRVGTPVLIHYDPSNPERAAIQGYDGAGVDWLFAMIGAVVGGGTVVVLLIVLFSH